VTPAELASASLLVVGGVFFLAGTVGVLRFPDARARLHALTKADNLGLGFVCAGLAVHEGSLAVALKLFLIWLLALTASAVSSHLIADATLRDDDAETASRARE
jgi:multicomponent Na+:H+ antiporter subunit G